MQPDLVEDGLRAGLVAVPSGPEVCLRLLFYDPEIKDAVIVSLRVRLDPSPAERA